MCSCRGLCLLFSRRISMSPYYEQPRGQRESEEVAGALVLLACAVIAFAWFIAVSRFHVRTSQCLELFLYCAVLLFGGGLIVSQVLGRRRKRQENWPHPALRIRAPKDA